MVYCDRINQKLMIKLISKLSLSYRITYIIVAKLSNSYILVKFSAADIEKRRNPRRYKQYESYSLAFILITFVTYSNFVTRDKSFSLPHL